LHDCLIDKKHPLWNRFLLWRRGKASRMEAKMPGDPKECRQHALNCVRLAQTSASPHAREHFANLARTWIRLADELEKTQAFLAALDDETEPIKRTG
jgi:hypothetical protein